MTINIKGAVSSHIMSRVCIAYHTDGWTSHDCCACQKQILDRKHKVMASLRFPRYAAVSSHEKQFYFCHECYQALDVHKADCIADIKGCVSRYDWSAAASCLKEGDGVITKPCIAIAGGTDTRHFVDWGPTWNGASPQRLCVYLGKTSTTDDDGVAELMHFYCADEPHVKMWPGSFVTVFHTPEVCKRRLASGYNKA